MARRQIMARERKARLFRNGGSQAVRLPAEFRFDGEEVYITRDEATGDVILSARPRRDVWKDYIAFRDSLDIPREDLDRYMAERPMNQTVGRRSVFEGEM
jgi:antitoxin VapB